MKKSVIILTLFLTFTVCISQESYHADTVRYFELNGTEQQYSNAIDQMFDLLKTQYSAKNVPDAVWQEFQNNRSASLTNIKSLLVSAYRSNFTHDDIKGLIRFYESDTGQQLVKDGTKLNNVQKNELSVFFDSDIGKKVQNQSESLRTMVSEVSELWSRDLYNETIEKLKIKGY